MSLKIYNNSEKDLTEYAIKNVIKPFIDRIFSLRNRIDETYIEQIRNSFLKMLEPDKSKIDFDLYNKLVNAINAISSFMNREEIIAKIKENSITKSQLLEMYIEKTTENKTSQNKVNENKAIDTKRIENVIIVATRSKYDMTDLYNSSLIAKDKNKNFKKAVKLKVQKENLEHIFRSDDGKVFAITCLGELEYIEWNNINSFLTFYNVRDMNAGEEYKVYSNIDIQKMHDEEYKKIVLNELLDENNIKKSKCGGYIGEICYEPIKISEKSSTKENQDSARYTYRVNDKYVLQYRAEDVSAAMSLPILRVINGDKKDIKQNLEYNKYNDKNESRDK